MLFTRASASHFLTWLKLPAGSGFSAASLPPRNEPGHSPQALPPLYRSDPGRDSTVAFSPAQPGSCFYHSGNLAGIRTLGL